MPERNPALFTLAGVSPKIAPDAYVAPTAAVIGNVTLGSRSSIWFHCVVRGDTCAIRIGDRSNIQDGTVMHVTGDTKPCIVGNDVTVGHSAILHACTLEDFAFVGMGATVLDGAVIERGGMLGAAALLTPGKRIGPNELWTGAPARFQRVMSPEERSKFDQNAIHYVERAAEYLAGLGK